MSFKDDSDNYKDETKENEKKEKYVPLERCGKPHFQKKTNVDVR
jgi:hypothetical protein